MKLSTAVNVHNFHRMRQYPPQEFENIRFDPINNCNVQCVYCHSVRNKEIISTEDFSAYLKNNIIGVDHFQMGCGMEPTMDPRLADLMLMVAASRAKPALSFRLQTNGTLLHRHDTAKMRAAGLSRLTVSIDSADPDIHRSLRGGTNLEKVLSNLTEFKRTLPEVELVFISVVTQLNIRSIPELILFGQSLGVSRYELREMIYDPANTIVDHSKIPDIILPSGRFKELQQTLGERFGERPDIEYYSSDTLEDEREKIRRHSLLQKHQKESAA